MLTISKEELKELYKLMLTEYPDILDITLEPVMEQILIHINIQRR